MYSLQVHVCWYRMVTQQCSANRPYITEEHTQTHTQELASNTSNSLPRKIGRFLPVAFFSLSPSFFLSLYPSSICSYTRFFPFLFSVSIPPFISASSLSTIAFSLYILYTSLESDLYTREETWRHYGVTRSLAHTNREFFSLSLLKEVFTTWYILYKERLLKKKYSMYI